MDKRSRLTELEEAEETAQFEYIRAKSVASEAVQAQAQALEAYDRAIEALMEAENNA
jgi:hypothetical protein